MRKQNKSFNCLYCSDLIELKHTTRFAIAIVGDSRVNVIFKVILKASCVSCQIKQKKKLNGELSAIFCLCRLFIISRLNGVRVTLFLKQQRQVV